MRVYLIGGAALALAASTAFADPGKGHGAGNGGGNGGGHAAAAPDGGKGGGQAQGGGKQAKASPAAQMRAEKPAKADRGPSAHVAAQHADRGPDRKASAAVAHGNGNGNGNAKVDKARNVKADTREIRQVREVRDQRVSVRRDNDPRLVRTVVHFDRAGDRGLIDGCPPGLAKKNNGCMPPGLARERDGYRSNYYQPSWFGYSSLNDGRYAYDNGYLYRMNDAGSVLGYIPLLGGALSVGNPWPSYYQPVPVPDYYRDYYNLGSPNTYRYADDVLYRVDPQTDAITSIAALLTGDQFGIGQRMPAGYDVYNVPYAYRDQYYDTPEYDYRYSDGYVYQVDPTTQLIQAAIQLLT